MFNWNRLVIYFALFRRKNKKGPCSVFLYLSGQVHCEEQGSSWSTPAPAPWEVLAPPCLSANRAHRPHCVPRFGATYKAMFPALCLLRILGIQIYFQKSKMRLVHFRRAPALSVVVIISFLKLPFFIKKLTAIQFYKYSMQQPFEMNSLNRFLK